MDEAVIPNFPFAEALSASFAFFFPCFFFLLSLIFLPFYLHIFRQNRKKDQKTAIFPIVNHFYQIVKWYFYVVLFDFHVAIMFILWFFFTEPARRDTPGTPTTTRTLWIFFQLFIYALSSFLNIIFIFLLIIVHQVQCILHFLLSLQRFLLYYYPETEKYVTLTENSMKRVINWLYFICIIITLSFFLFGTFYIGEFDSWIIFVIHVVQVIYLIALNIFPIISITIYLLIMRSVRKMTHLASSMQSKPHNYIFYQAILILITRIPAWCFGTGSLLNNSNSDFVSVLISMDIVEFLQIPFTIETTYLFCNRQNVKSIISTCNLMHILNARYRTTQIRPSAIEMDSTRVLG